MSFDVGGKASAVGWGGGGGREGEGAEMGRGDENFFTICLFLYFNVSNRCLD